MLIYLSPTTPQQVIGNIAKNLAILRMSEPQCDLMVISLPIVLTRATEPDVLLGSVFGKECNSAKAVHHRLIISMYRDAVSI